MNKLIKEYYKILSKDYPTWLDEYINTTNMQRQKNISVTCGKINSKLFDYHEYTSLEHSIGVALIIWNFTHDKKETLSGLFHDIATPSFKHSIDFLNGDYMNQESTEDLTKTILLNSKDIMSLLKRDNISIDEVCDYHIYPIADNDTPKLSADRLENCLSNALITNRMRDLETIRKIYNDIEIETNEEGIIELGFKTKKLARDFVRINSNLSISYRDDSTRFFMQALADTLKKLGEDNLLTKEDLYIKSEKEIINIIKKSKYKEAFNELLNATKINKSNTKPDNMYYVNHGAKVRYIDPLFKGNRISKECKIANKIIEKNLSYKMDNYLYLNDKLNILN